MNILMLANIDHGAERDPTEVEQQQADVFNRSMEIYIERAKQRGELWAQFDEHDAFHHMRSKLARIGVFLADGRYRLPDGAADGANPSPSNSREVMLDEAYDLINYAAFIVRHLTGEKPDVPRTEI